MFSAGIDLGSVACKAVLVEEGSVVHFTVCPTQGTRLRQGREFLDLFLEEAGVTRSAVAFVGVTGYGRVSASFADKISSEILCHARGVVHLIPVARTIIDIGGQDTKVIRTNRDAEVVNFLMNDKCVAGTGRFIETMARALEISREDMGNISLRSTDPSSISSTCTVFAESEIIGLLASGQRVEDIVAGVHQSVARRIQQMVQRVGLERQVVLTGGVAYNRGVHAMLQRFLGQDIRVPEIPQIPGALGAALLYREVSH